MTQSSLATPFYDQVGCVDFETFFAKDFTLTSKTQSMTEYIRSPRFEAQTCAVQLDSWNDPEVAVGAKQIRELLHSVDWDKTAFLAHHTHFDGLIATEHFGIEPVFWLDNMPISRTVYGVDVAHSHAALAARVGISAKKNAGNLSNVQGKYLADMTQDEIKGLCTYNIDDCREELLVFRKIWQYLPFEELRIFDATLRMYCEPLLELDEERLRGLHEREVDRRAALVEDAGTTASVLGSAPKFADLLRSLGVVPPMKISPKTKKPTYAFAKTDLDFKSLLSHPDEAVRKAVEARLANKGSIVETRSKRLIKRVGLPTPVYLAPAAARTLRWGGGDLSNWQNLPSTGDGANLRRAILAPSGAKIIGADASQVEARMAAWLARFDRKLKAFSLYDQKLGPDVYCISAEGVYGRPIVADIDTFERFIGKVLELSCQYGAGAVRVKHSLAQGFRGAPPVHMELYEVRGHITRWRKANQPLVDYWHDIENAVFKAWVLGKETEFGPLVFEHFKDDGYIHLPNGTFLKYPNAGRDELNGNLFYTSRNGYVKLWGGHLLENVSQALCAALLKHHMIRVMDELPMLRIVLLVHDEMVSLAKTDVAQEYAERVKEIMSVPVDWCADMPLNAAVKVGDYYDKA